MIRGKREKRKSRQKKDTTEVVLMEMELGVALKNNL